MQTAFDQPQERGLSPADMPRPAGQSTNESDCFCYILCFSVDSVLLPKRGIQVVCPQVISHCMNVDHVGLQYLTGQALGKNSAFRSTTVIWATCRRSIGML